jgi:phosphatidylglycerophosphatase A
VSDESQNAGGHVQDADRSGQSVTAGLADKLFLFVGSLGYVGYVPCASGTVAVAVIGVPVYLALRAWLGLGAFWYGAVIVAFTLFSVWVAGHADRVLNEKDSKKNVIDELPGYFIALWALPVTWQLVAAAFFLERAIDIAKIWPARWIERHVPGGWGVVLDDVVAGFYTLALLSLGVSWQPAWFGVP